MKEELLKLLDECVILTSYTLNDWALRRGMKRDVVRALMDSCVESGEARLFPHDGHDTWAKALPAAVAHVRIPNEKELLSYGHAANRRDILRRKIARLSAELEATKADLAQMSGDPDIGPLGSAAIEILSILESATSREMASYLARHVTPVNKLLWKLEELGLIRFSSGRRWKLATQPGATP